MMTNPSVSKALSAYATANSTVPPLIAVTRLFERATANVQRAREAARSRRFDTAFAELDRTITILTALDSVLDMGRGGGVAQDLRRFYRVMIHQAASIPARPDPVAAADGVARQLGVMTEAWKTVAQTHGTPRPAERGAGRHTPPGATVKEPSASVIERSMKHANGSLFG
ncbi:flagellar protein FliS [Azospirillum fermentarium]|uniref:flagellar export chaperone FliS n=1 Tax=Azospirillum fermentarium TaxID=1233114 RepID=UPI0022273F69|nr:flagellar export chaperone FliS [Azospirillum fermentarium]MCW2249084.1 flagellar protein FliS [Azospirillum fermentarium]